MKFTSGCQPGPGRPTGSVSGRREALRVLDEMLGDQTNKDTLQAALQAEFTKDPVRFFRAIVMPLLPAETKLSIAQEGGVVKWQSLLDTMPQTPEQHAAHAALIRANAAHDADMRRTRSARAIPLSAPTPSENS